MGKLIAVWGVPEAGKSTLSMKLAEAIYSRSRGKSIIIVVFTDIVTPTLPVVFPNLRSEDIFSVGSVLSKPDFFADDIAANFIIPKGHTNLAFLGYKAGENTHSYPTYTIAKAKYFYDVLLSLSDYVIIDCMADPDANTLTKAALERADRTIWMSTPSLKSISYQISQNKLFAAAGYIKKEDISIVNIARHELLTQDTKAGKTYTLPYSAAFMEQYMEGGLISPLKDKRYMQVLRAIVEEVI